MSGYGGLYWPWSCPMAEAGRPNANSNNITAVNVKVVVGMAAAVAMVAVTATDGRILLTAADSPERQVVTS